MSDEDRAQRGRRAHAEFQQLGGAFDAVSAAIVTKLVQTPPGDPDTILKLHMAVQNLAAVRKALLAVAQDGLMAEAAIENSGLINQ